MNLLLILRLFQMQILKQVLHDEPKKWLFWDPEIYFSKNDLMLRLRLMLRPRLSLRIRSSHPITRDMFSTFYPLAAIWGGSTHPLPTYEALLSTEDTNFFAKSTNFDNPGTLLSLCSIFGLGYILRLVLCLDFIK